MNSQDCCHTIIIYCRLLGSNCSWIYDDLLQYDLMHGDSGHLVYEGKFYVESFSRTQLGNKKNKKQKKTLNPAYHATLHK